MTDLTLSSAAEEDYAEALASYAARSVEAAERFDADLDHALATIASDPERYPQCDQRHRFYLMRHFPYQVIYRQHKAHWIVIAVAHTSRKPRYWSRR